MAEWRKFEITPVDVWTFRDGRPFSAGEDTRARSHALPSPFTLLGAFRTAALLEKGIAPKDFYEGRTPCPEWGKAGPFPGDFALRGPFWRKADTIYFPLPADVVRITSPLKNEAQVAESERRRKEEENEYALLSPLKDPPFQTSLPNSSLYPLWIKKCGNPTAPGDLYLSLEGLLDYLTKKPISEKHLAKPSDFYEREVRMGIHLESKRRTVKEGFLYRAEYIRLHEGVSLYVEVSLPKSQNQSMNGFFLHLGGERRMAYLREVTPGRLKDLPRPKSLPPKLKVILLSPAWFSGGYQPKGRWAGLLGGYKLIAVALPSPQRLSTFVYKDGRAYQWSASFVPAGSVYFFERESGGSSTSAPPPAFTEKPSFDGDDGEEVPLDQLGFGLYVTSDWDYA